MSAAAIYAAVAALPMQISAKTPSVSMAATAKLAVVSVDLPLRVISLRMGHDSATTSAITIGLNPSLQLTYQISDTLLWKDSALGDVWSGDEAPLLSYLDAYALAYRQHREISTGAHWMGLTLSPGIYEFGGGKYLGVKAELNIVENIA